MVNVNEVIALLSNSNLQQIECDIADKMSCEIYKDNIHLLAGFIKDEVDSSMLSIRDIESFIDNNSKEIIDFALRFLGKSKIQSLSIGIAITYSVYLIYLKDKGAKEILEYLKRRRIPKPQKLLEQLWNIKKEMGI